MNGESISGRPASIWLATTAQTNYPSLLGDKSYDVVVIGAGIAGIMTAYYLAGNGLHVALVEADRIAEDVTGNTTGKLTSQHGLRYHHILKSFGQDIAQHYADANEWAIREVKRISDHHGIDCDYVLDSANIYCRKPEDHHRLEEELEVCRTLGLAASLVRPEDLPFHIEGALRFENQARFHPRKFLLGVLPLLESQGVDIYESTRVQEVVKHEASCEIITPHGVHIADFVAVCTHYPIYDSGFFVAKLAPYRSYALAASIEGVLPDGMYIDMDEWSGSFRKQEYEDRELLIIGSELHKVGQADDTTECYARLESWARQNFRVEKIHYRWSTQDNATIDRVPYIGFSPGTEHITMATGFDGWGMSTGVLAGKLLADLIRGIANPWSNVFDPSRMKLAGLGSLVSENANVAKHLIGGKLSGVDDRKVEELGFEEAAIMHVAGQRAGVYRDREGQLFIVSASCTHMGCQLHWNTAESSWDCPCHGSRFSPSGDVLHGPAVKPLARLGPEMVGRPVIAEVEPATG